MSIISKTIRESDFEQILDPLDTKDPGYNATEEVSADILKFGGNRKC